MSPNTTLGDLAVIRDSERIPLSGMERAKRQGPFPYYGAAGVLDHVDDYLFEGVHVLVGEDGSVETEDGGPVVQLVDGQFWVNNHAHVIRAAAPEDTRFLYFALQRTKIRPYLSGSVQAKLTQAGLRRIRIPYPAEDERRRTVQILGLLDDKIELNRRMSWTLEETARAVFRSWFVDFDPIRGAPTVSDDIRQLFPDRLVDSPIGLVPEGWEVVPLGEHVEVTRGLSYTGAGLADEGMPLHNLNSIREGGGYKEDGIKYYVGEYRERDRVRPGDVIVANTEQGFEHLLIGYPAIVPRAFGDDGLYSHHIYRVRPLEGSPLTAGWLYLLLVGGRMHQQVAGYANGTTVNMLPKDGLTRQLIAVPPRETVERFDAIVAPMFDQQEALTAESKTLAELRDALLPKLVSGEIRLPVEAA